MATVWIVNGSRKDGAVTSMTACANGVGSVLAEARATKYGWIVEPGPRFVDGFADMTASVGNQAEAYSALRKLGLAILPAA